MKQTKVIDSKRSQDNKQAESYLIATKDIVRKADEFVASINENLKQFRSGK